MHLKIYRWLSFLAGPLIDLYLIRRKKIGKEDAARFHERLGYPSLSKPLGSLIWIHAASVGEAISVLPLINSIIEKYTEINVLITTGTVTSAKLLESRLPARAFHQYIPIDKLLPVRRFLAHWQPDLALWVESELWPNLIIEAHKTGCIMIQINARISIHSYEKWKRYNKLAKKLLSCFSLSLAQSEDDRKRLKNLGAPNTKYVGNLKFDAPALPADPVEMGKLVSMIKNRPLWVVASTHSGEEELIAAAHKILKKKHTDILTIIIPRHPNRGKEIASIFTSNNIKTILRTQGNDLTNDIEIYIADTIGELGLFYRLSGIVFMGGSLVNHGGQNPLEAARLDCALLTGPYTDNFSRIYKELEGNNAVIIVKDADDLANRVSNLLTNHEVQHTLANTALELMKSKEGVLDAFLEELTPYFISRIN